MAPALADLKLHGSGKVREVYEDGNDLIMVASDRISVYDVVLPTEIPDKGKVLNKMSLFWFELTGDIVPNHFISEDVPPEAEGRGMRVRKLDMFPVECVVRGYITGSGWKEYQETGEVCGIELPEGLQESEKLPEPIFTPATKAELGEHDENIDFDRAAEIVGDRALMEELRRISIEIYQRGADHAAERGIILADTKFELGSHAGAEVVLGGRGADPGLLALLAGRHLGAGQGASLLRQAVRPRLRELPRLGQDRARTRAARRRGRATRGPSTSRPTSASPSASSSALTPELG